MPTANELKQKQQKKRKDAEALRILRREEQAEMGRKTAPVAKKKTAELPKR